MNEVTLIQVGAASSFAVASVLYWAARAAADGWFNRNEGTRVPVRVSPSRRPQDDRRVGRRPSFGHALRSSVPS